MNIVHCTVHEKVEWRKDGKGCGCVGKGGGLCGGRVVGEVTGGGVGGGVGGVVRIRILRIRIICRIWMRIGKI